MMMRQKSLEFKHLFPQGHIPDSQQKKQGVVSILLSMIILASLLAIGLSTSGWIISSFELSRGTVMSAPAYYAAETGIEALLYDILINENSPAVQTGYLSGTLGNNAALSVDILADSPLRAKSTGEFNGNRRSIEIQ